MKKKVFRERQVEEAKVEEIKVFPVDTTEIQAVEPLETTVPKKKGRKRSVKSSK